MGRAEAIQAAYDAAVNIDEDIGALIGRLVVLERGGNVSLAAGHVVIAAERIRHALTNLEQEGAAYRHERAALGRELG